MTDRPASESLTTALSVQPDAPKPAAKADVRPPEGEFKLAEVREDGTFIIENSEGAMYEAALGERVDRPRKGAKLRVTEKDGAHTIDGTL